MTDISTPPGWYYADGDPLGSQRYWDGSQWQGGPQPAAGQYSAEYPIAGGGRDADRSPLEWYKLAWSRWNQFDGRARRAEYWWFTGVNVLVFVVLYAFMFAGAAASDGGAGPVVVVAAIMVGLYALAVFIPSLAVAIRRLHDTDRSGWWLLLSMIPIVNYIGSFVVLAFQCMDGTKGPNKYGASPKY
jgi:uncharacterized membrane protein YhaH (DUF805 family)